MDKIAFVPWNLASDIQEVSHRIDLHIVKVARKLSAKGMFSDRMQSILLLPSSETVKENMYCKIVNFLLAMHKGSVGN